MRTLPLQMSFKCEHKYGKGKQRNGKVGIKEKSQDEKW